MQSMKFLGAASALVLSFGIASNKAHAAGAPAGTEINNTANVSYTVGTVSTTANSNLVNYANGNAASVALINESIRNDPGVFPTPEVKAKLFPDLAESAEVTRLLNRTWTRFTTGK